MNSDIPTLTIQKRPGETLDRVIDLRAELVQPWRAGVDVVGMSYARPTKANGFDYQASADGRTAAVEPHWPTTIGQTVTDGSLTWTCRAPGTNAVDTIAGNATVTPPTGITATHVSTDAKGEVKIRVNGGTVGRDYPVLVSATTTAGQVIQVEVVVEVRLWSSLST